MSICEWNRRIQTLLIEIKWHCMVKTLNKLKLKIKIIFRKKCQKILTILIKIHWKIQIKNKVKFSLIFMNQTKDFSF